MFSPLLFLYHLFDSNNFVLFLAGVSYFVINVVIIRFYYEKKILKFLISYNDPLFQIKSELLSKTNSKINFF